MPTRHQGVKRGGLCGIGPRSLHKPGARPGRPALGVDHPNIEPLPGLEPCEPRLDQGEALGALTTRYPSLQKHLRDAEGKLRSFVNVYLGEEDIRFLQKEATPVGAGAELTIVPSIAGGAA